MKPYRKDANLSYCIGVFPTLELLHSRPHCVRRILLSHNGESNTGVQQIKMLCQQQRIRVEYADRAIQRIAECGNAYAVGEFVKYATPLTHGNHIVLVNPQDGGNFGTILRTALAFGMTQVAVILPAVDYMHPKVIRASMGAIFHLNIAVFNSIDEYQAEFPNHFYPFMTDGRTPLAQAAFVEAYSLIFGGESGGLDPAYHEFGESVRIPHASAVDSLNLSVAVGIALNACQWQKEAP